MKVHIFSKFDTLDKIINQYAITIDELKKANEELNIYSLKEGDKIKIIKTKNSFKEVSEEIKLEQEEFQKYICPHCKQVILIPK